MKYIEGPIYICKNCGKIDIPVIKKIAKCKECGWEENLNDNN